MKIRMDPGKQPAGEKQFEISAGYNSDVIPMVILILFDTISMLFLLVPGRVRVVSHIP